MNSSELLRRQIMATRELEQHLQRLERVAFTAVRRTDGGYIDCDHYLARGRQTWRRVLGGMAATAGRTVTRTVIEPARRRRRVRVAYRELMALDDRMLADIGLRRVDIPAVARGAGWAQPQARVRAVDRPDLKVISGPAAPPPPATQAGARDAAA
jgi:uncharacterized protein YjiS (DUF1127 family)